MKKTIISFVILFLAFLPCFSIRDLAADSMMGRKSGQPGGTLAEEYVASRFSEWDLEPAGVDGTYFQPITFEHMNIEPGVAFEVVTEHERCSFLIDQSHRSLRSGWRVGRYSGSGHFMADTVFVGYGIYAPDKGYDDFSGVDVMGKTALLVYDTPVRFSSEFPETININQRINAVQSRGARAVLLCTSPETAGRRYGEPLNHTAYKPDFPILHIARDVTEFIFKDLDTELPYLISKMDENKKSVSFETGVKTFISVNAIYDPNRTARNVLGRVTGSDDLLKDEVIIIGAHLDHIGINPRGEVMNGANDNASGVSVLMEIARVLKLNRKFLKRSVVFFPWAAEEQYGFAGLVHYCQHPIFPLEKTVAYISMDMVGQGSGKVRLNNVWLNDHLWSVLEKKLPGNIMEYAMLEYGSQRIHDRHTDFPAEGVPRFGLSTEGPHLKFHQSRDDLDLIQPELIKKTGDLVLAMAEILATESADLIPDDRKTRIYFKHLTQVNFSISSLEDLAEYTNKTKDPNVDVQLIMVDKSVSAMREDDKKATVNSLFDISDSIEKSDRFSLFSSSYGVRRSIRNGMTTLLAGIRETGTWKDDPRWLEVYEKQGLGFLSIDDAGFLFYGQHLSPEGKRILRTIERNRILPLFSGVESWQAHEILKEVRKPVMLFGNTCPEGKVARLLKKTNSVFGLILARNESPESFLERMKKALGDMGIDHLAIVNQDSLWEETGRKQMLELISGLLENHYHRVDILKLTSSNFLRVLDEIKY